MLMERRPSRNVAAEEWQNYLLAAARENRPLNQVMGELLRADGTDPKNRGPARFYLDRELEPNLITRDVGRIFFGRDLQCAHCHDHPLVEDYRQSDYYGLLAFFAPGYDPVTKEGAKKTAYPEKAGTDLAFDSVFVKGDHHLTGPRVPGGPELAEPVFPPGEEYRVKPAGNVLAVPRHSRRAMLASMATGGANRAFNENVANRLWAMMMGRGLVHPIDLSHPANPPSHPELLRLLGEEIAALKFDVKAFLRELALTDAYQRTIDLPGDVSAAVTAVRRRAGRAQGRVGAAGSRRRGCPRGIREGGQGLASGRGCSDPDRRRAGEGPAQARRRGQEGGGGREGTRRGRGGGGRSPRCGQGAGRGRRQGPGRRQEAAEGEGTGRRGARLRDAFRGRRDRGGGARESERRQGRRVEEARRGTSGPRQRGRAG